MLLDYSMDQTIYFPTLDQYKCNPGLVIQSDVSTPVGAPANARILEVGSNEEIGNYVVMDLAMSTQHLRPVKGSLRGRGRVSEKGTDPGLRVRAYKVLFRGRRQCIL